MFGFLNNNTKSRTDFEVKKPTDIYVVLKYLDNEDTNDALRFVVNELIANVIEHKEEAHIYIRDNIVHVLIDKKSLDDVKIFQIKLAILMTSKFHEHRGELRLGGAKYGGLGMKSIYNLGYDLAYEESKDSFSIVAYRHEPLKKAS